MLISADYLRNLRAFNYNFKDLISPNPLIWPLPSQEKNNQNLQQTQKGVEAFKDQIESLKSELQEERMKVKEGKKNLDKVYISRVSHFLKKI